MSLPDAGLTPLAFPQKRVVLNPPKRTTPPKSFLAQYDEATDPEEKKQIYYRALAEYEREKASDRSLLH
jgi:hypothetical protein